MPQGVVKSNICITCEKACGGCSWSAVDPRTNKVRFEPVPGWTAKKVLLNLGTKHSKTTFCETYHITACPEYVPAVERKMQHDRH